MTLAKGDVTYIHCLPFQIEIVDRFSGRGCESCAAQLKGKGVVVFMSSCISLWQFTLGGMEKEFKWTSRYFLLKELVKGS